MKKTKPWQYFSAKKLTAPSFNRRKILILCEDSKSSCFYFRGFNIDSNLAEVLTIGAGMCTDSLVLKAVEYKEKAEKKKESYNEIWCVFDRDDHPLEGYRRAFQIAKSHRIKIAWTNEAFEFWYLLHFNYHIAGIRRHDYKEKLKPYIDYDKADRGIYEKMKPHQTVALKNAKRLVKHLNDIGVRIPEDYNPSTGIHHLVEILNDISELDED